MRLIIPPPVQGIIFAALMWAANRALPALAVSFAGQKPLALAVGGAGVVIEIIAVTAFFRARTTVNPLAPSKARHLVTGGLYRFSRNPMYLGLLLALTGWCLWLGNIVAAPFLIFYVLYINWSQIIPEENILRDKFGEDYKVYCKRVQRWL